MSMPPPQPLGGYDDDHDSPAGSVDANTPLGHMGRMMISCRYIDCLIADSGHSVAAAEMLVLFDWRSFRLDAFGTSANVLHLGPVILKVGLCALYHTRKTIGSSTLQGTPLA